MLYAQVVLPLAQPAYTFEVDEKLGVVVGDAVCIIVGMAKLYMTVTVQ